MRISDWSSDVCSSDLCIGHGPDDGDASQRALDGLEWNAGGDGNDKLVHAHGSMDLRAYFRHVLRLHRHDTHVRCIEEWRFHGGRTIGRAPGRERVWQYVKVLRVAVSLYKKKK